MRATSNALSPSDHDLRIPPEKESDDELRSNEDSVPGEEFPVAIYRSIVIAFAWMMVAAWLAFGGVRGTDLDLAVATVLFVVFLTLPIIMHRTVVNRQAHEPHPSPQRFRSSEVEIATGMLSERDVWLQVLLIPAALALAATIIGAVYGFMS